jgi:uncharacterized protein HemX
VSRERREKESNEVHVTTFNKKSRGEKKKRSGLIIIIIIIIIIQSNVIGSKQRTKSFTHKSQARAQSIEQQTQSLV